jgi:hypothetical protein
MRTFIFLTGEKVQVLADTLEEAERLLSLGEYEQIETETILLDEI